MKRIFTDTALLFVCAAFSIGCTDAEIGNDKPLAEVAELDSFGFYAEDNPGVLSEDYTTPISGEMLIRLPAETDKTALVARFTATDNTKVFVQQNEQKSGTTPNDFTYPVDYLVQNKEAGTAGLYTVKVGKILKMKWTQVAAFCDKLDGEPLVNNDFAMTVSPVTREPAFMLKRYNKPSGASGRTATSIIVKMENGEMKAGPDITYASDGEALVAGTLINVAADASGAIYGFYYYSSEKKMFVRTEDGTIIGAPFGNISVSSYGPVMDIDPQSGKIIAIAYCNATGAVIPRYGLSANYYDGTAWSTENPFPVTGSRMLHYSKYKTGDAFYVCGVVHNTSYYILKYNNNKWETLYEGLPDGISVPMGVSAPTMAVASDGTVYLCAAGDEDSSGTYFIKVYKLVPGDTQLTLVGGLIAPYTGKSSTAAISLYEDLPVVLYYNYAEDKLLYSVSLDTETKDWAAPIPVCDIPSSSSNLAIAAGNTGINYAAFLGNDDQKTLYVYQYALEADE